MPLRRCAIGFWESIFGGQNTNLNQDISASNQIGGFATNTGEGNITAGSNFMKAILSGDSSKQSQALAPEISAAKTSAANSNKTAAMFGNRSGGTAASTAATTDKLHSTITNLIGSLTGSSASNLLSSGSTLLGQGQSAYGQEANLSQIRVQNWANSILGKGVTSAVQGAESLAMGAAGGALPGGPGAAAGAQGAFASYLNG